jgi:pilus assembly protein CpaB
MRRGSSSLFIIVGLFLLLAAGAAGVLLLYSPAQGILANNAGQLPPTAEPMMPVVEALIDIEEGTVITATEDLLKMGEVPASQFVQGVNLVSVEDARNMIATTPLKAGEPIRQDSLRKAGLAQKIPAPKAGEESVKAFPVQVNSLSGVADLVQSGDFVDVVGSFNLDVVTLRPGGVDTQDGQNKYIVTEQTTNEGTAKIILQDVEVLDVIKPAPPTESEEGAEPTPEPAPETQSNGDQSAPPKPVTNANTLNAGNWIIVIAVTNQEAEVLRFALDRGIGITTLLRRAGDHATERTVGATMRILVDNYGMPMPSFPQVSQQPLIEDIPGPTRLPQIETPAFAPKIDNE